MSEATAPAVDYLSGYAAVQGDKIALIDDRRDRGVEKLTYRELNARANQLAHALIAYGLEPGQSVIWCGQNSPGCVAMGHASRKAGLTAVPLNYRLTDEEATYVVDNSDAVLVWTDAEFADLFLRIKKGTPKIRDIIVFGLDGADAPDGTTSAESFLDGHSDADLPVPQSEGRTMIYTSGTTGKPKGAVRTGTGDPEQIKAMVGHLGLRPDDVYITTGPLYHSGPGGLMGIAFLMGQTIVLQRKFDPEDWMRIVEAHKVTSTFSAPTPIRRICNLPQETKDKYDCTSMRVMIANAAPWSFALKKAYVADFPPESLWEVYGSTELGINMMLEPKDQMRKPGSCGKPSPMNDVKLIDEDGNEVTEPNVPGEVYVRSRSIFDTYHKAQDKYEEDALEDFHTVGDIAYRDEEGFYFICDRKKDMIISGGVNIYPAEIEAALEGHEKIYEAAVFGIPDEEWGEAVHACVVLHPGQQMTLDELAAYSRDYLAGYKVPRSVDFIAELPKTGSGKILKRQLREPYWKEAGRAL